MTAKPSSTLKTAAELIDQGPSLADPVSPASPYEAEHSPAAKPELSALRIGVTNEELAHLSLLVRQLEIFEHQIRDLTAPFAAQRTKIVYDAYLADSSPENYQAFKLAAIEEGMIERHVIPATLKPTVEGARETFVIGKVLPFLEPIRDRNLAVLRAKLTEVTARENALHVETFGTPIQNSVKISQAGERVSGLEDLRADKFISAAQAQKFYEYFQTLPLLDSPAESSEPPSL